MENVFVIPKDKVYLDKMQKELQQQKKIVVIGAPIFSTVIGGTAFGAAGLTEAAALNEGYDIITATFDGIDKHPGTLPGTNKQSVKLITGKETGV